MDRGAWQTTVPGGSKSWTQLSLFHFYLCPVCLFVFLIIWLYSMLYLWKLQKVFAAHV